jgi:ABC-type multidrug transport system ATPase subunit/ABC-type multidrug transport system permease subunit
MTVTWEHIKYTVNLPKHLGGGTKVLLHHVSGVARPGRLMALMGASGAGKTTLLDVIAGRKTTGILDVRSVITLNGHPKEAKSFSRLTAYVEQQDIHCGFATVRESLDFSASLRLPTSVTTEQRVAFVEQVLELLELKSIADRKVGDAGAADGLSPGQRKILTIGVELVSNAPIIFLDEPTSGLDSRAASMVMRVVRNIVNTGRTVITTIHQPSAELFFLMDDLLLLQRGGYMVYCGPVGQRGKNVVKYLESIPGTPKHPRRMNPASWMLDVLAGTDSSGADADKGVSAEEDAFGKAQDEAEHADHVHATPTPHVHSDVDVPMGLTGPLNALIKSEAEHEAQIEKEKKAAADLVDLEKAHANKGLLTGQQYQARLFESKEWEDVVKNVKTYSTPAPGSKPYQFSSLYPTSFIHQLVALVGRTGRSYYRNVEYNFTRITVLCGLMLLFGTIYYKVDASDVGGIQSMVSTMFFTTVFIAMLCMNTALPVLVRERAVFNRERFSYMYQAEAYGLAYDIVELPWTAIVILTCVPIVYFMTGFTPTASAFFSYALVTYVFTYTLLSLGMAAAAFFSTVDVAQAVVGFVLPLMFVFGGLFISVPNIPTGWRWANTIDPIRYAFTALIPAQFYCVATPTTTCPTIINLQGQSEDRFQYVEANFDAPYSMRWNNLGYLCIFLAVFQVFHLLALRFISHVKR